MVTRVPTFDNGRRTGKEDFLRLFCKNLRSFVSKVDYYGSIL